jgi:hypothetical protein
MGSLPLRSAAKPNPQSTTRLESRIAKSLPTEGREEVRDAGARSDRAAARPAKADGYVSARSSCARRTTIGGAGSRRHLVEDGAEGALVRPEVERPCATPSRRVFLDELDRVPQKSESSRTLQPGDPTVSVRPIPGSRSSTTVRSPAAARPRPCSIAPASPNTRGQMAVFLVRTFSLP